MTGSKTAVIAIIKANKGHYPIEGKDFYGEVRKHAPVVELYSPGINGRYNGFKIVMPYLSDSGGVYNEDCIINDSYSPRGGYPRLWEIIGVAEFLIDLIDEDANEITKNMYKDLKNVINELEKNLPQKNSENKYNDLDAWCKRYGETVEDIALRYWDRKEIELKHALDFSIERTIGASKESIRKMIHKETGVPPSNQPKHLVEAWAMHRKLKHETKQNYT